MSAGIFCSRAAGAKMLVLSELFLCLSGLGPAASGGEPARKAAQFSRRPTVQSKGAIYSIAFSVSAVTDVAVEIVDARGRVVRHLASGMLGAKNLPPAPLKPGLAQSLEWDGKDDAGKPVAGACRARVRLGLGVEFDRFVVDPKEGKPAGPIEPGLALGEKNGLAVDSKGHIHVLLTYGTAGAAGRTENRLVVLSPEGKYLRSIVPFRASMPQEKLRGVDFLSAEPARLQPRVYERVSTTFLAQFQSMPLQTMTMTKDDRLVLTSGWRSELFGFGPRVMLVINADGSIPRERFNGPVLARGITGGLAHVGVSPDGRYAYITGLADGRYYDPAKDPKSLHNTVLRVEMDKLESSPEVFFGKHKTAGNDGSHLNDPRGLAVDGKGNVYVSDHMNDRVLVISPAGKTLREMKASRPLTLVVNPSTQDVYVFTMAGELAKLDGAGKQAWKLQVSDALQPRLPTKVPALAIDSRGPESIIYLGSNYFHNKYRLLRIVDKGKKCESRELLPPLEGLGDDVVSVTPDDTVYVRQARGQSFLEAGATGERKPWWPKMYDRAILGRDGLCYTYIYNKPKKGDVRIERSTLEHKVLPMPGPDQISDLSIGAFWAGRRDNLFASPDGAFYYLEYLEQGGGKTRIQQYSPDGKLTGTLVDGLLGPSSVRVDRHGNVYTSDNLKPPGVYWPEEMNGFMAKLDKAGRTEYAESYGSILKFGPKGGNVKPGSAGTASAGTRQMELCEGEKKFVVEGLLDCFVGISPVPPLRSGFKSKCWCLAAQFDLDPHDRLFVPDSGRFSVHVMDANFNPILTFGGYDSIDAPQGQANAPGPEISFECPLRVNVSDVAAYVYDAAPCARRTMRLKLTYAAEETCEIK